MLKKGFHSGTYLLLFVVFTCASQVGCGDSNKSKLVGKWWMIDNLAVVELFSDNTYLISNIQGNKSFSDNGKWSLLEDGRIKLSSVNGKVILAVFEEEALIICFDKKWQVFFKNNKAPSSDIYYSLIYGKWQHDDGVTMLFEKGSGKVIVSSPALRDGIKTSFIIGGKFIKFPGIVENPNTAKIIKIDNNVMELAWLGGTATSYRKLN